MSEPAVEKIAQGILDLCAGFPVDDGFNAQVEALATVVGGIFFLLGKSREDALAAIDEAASAARQHICDHWGEVEQTDLKIGGSR